MTETAKETKPASDTSTTMNGTTKPASNTTKDDKFEYEFGGPVGTLVNIIFLPLLVLLLLHWADVGYVDLSFLEGFTNGKRFWDAFLDSPVLCPGCNDTTRLWRCTRNVLLWFLLQVVLERFLPCQIVKGAPVKGDKDNRLSYRMNGHLAFWTTCLLLELGYPTYHTESGYWQFGRVPLSTVYDDMPVYAFVSSVLCFLFSLYLYWSSFIGKDKILADPGNSGNAVYDFWMGRELNPRWGSFDWKVICELRPGLIGWMFLNLACLYQQYQNLGYVTGSMVLINLFQAVYVWDSMYQEPAILTTMDIVSDGFGFMLCFGDLAWLPFSYSLQARYLVHHDPHLSYMALAGVFGVYCFGFAFFRGANGQKDAFRKNPDDPALSHLKYLQTKRGTRLLTSGYWGMARKINYTGDYIMGVSWCLTAGFGSIVPYFYAIYFAVLLVHRSERDDKLCQEKYGDDWNTYKKMVPYRFVPGII